MTQTDNNINEKNDEWQEDSALPVPVQNPQAQLALAGITADIAEWGVIFFV